MALSHRKPVAGIDERVAAVERIGADETAVGLLDVVGDECLRAPLMAVGRVRAAVIEVVQQHELLGERVLVGRHLAPELHQVRITVALRQRAQHLIVSPVFLDDVEHVLEQRRLAQLLRDRHRLRMLTLLLMLAAPPAFLCELEPVVVLQHLLGVGLQFAISGERDDRGAAHVRVHVLAGLVGRRIRADLGIRPERADALVVGDDQTLVHVVGDDAARVPAGRDQALELRGAEPVVVQLIHGNGVVAPEAHDQMIVAHERDAVRGAAKQCARERLDVDGLHDLVALRVDDRHGVAVRVCYEQAAAVEQERGRLQADFDALDLHPGVEIDDGDRARRAEAGGLIGDDGGAARVVGEVAGPMPRPPTSITTA